MVVPKAEIEIDSVYIRRLKTMNIPFKFHTVQKTTKEHTVSNIGAMLVSSKRNEENQAQV
jgi:hypothetical protein